MDKEMHNLLNIETYRKTIWDTPEKELSYARQDRRSMRWFILLWVGAVSLWGSTQLLLDNYVRLPFGGFIVIIGWMNWYASSPLHTQLSRSPDQAPPLFVHTSYPISVIGVIVMVVQFCLHWICLSGRSRRHWSWLYFLLQGACVLAISLIWSDAIIVLGFYLVLVIEALSLLKQTRQIVIVSCTYLVLFISIVIWQLTQMLFWITLESVLFLMIFLIGWIILSIQQVLTRSQLEAAHLQLAAYAMRYD
jgi:hypothetical protein